MSLGELGIRGSSPYPRETRHRPTEGATGPRGSELGQSRIDHDRRRREQTSTASSDSRSQARQIEHQSSLRSLLSSSDVDPTEMEEEILRQIIEDGILDGIDLNSMNVSQEDELSEKIADAYRRRHGQRPRSRENRTQASTMPASREHRTQTERPRHSRQRSSNTRDYPAQPSHPPPPVSRPHLLDAYPFGQGHRRRTSSETRRLTSPIPPSANSRSSSEAQRQAVRSSTDLLERRRGPSISPLETQRQAARSSTDISERRQDFPNTRSRPNDFSNHGRRITDPERLGPRGSSGGTTAHGHPTSRSPNGRTREPLATSASQPSPNSIRIPRSPRSAIPSHAVRTGESPSQQSPLIPNTPSIVDATSPPQAARPQLQHQRYREPSISCDRCRKPSIEYELHENCDKCNNGNYNLCLRCYRHGLGCLQWYGFGFAALQRYERQAPTDGYAPSSAFPHRLKGHQYLQPRLEDRIRETSDNPSLMTSSDPSRRLQSGPFCSNCLAFAPNCFWKCDLCNEGEWGFCNQCVNQARCCTHSLLPVALTSSIHSQPTDPNQHAVPTPIDPSQQLTVNVHQSDPLLDNTYTPLTFSTKCDVCTYPIPPSTTRFHCPQCNEGDYDICKPCYFKLVKTGRTTTENGPNGWRRCLKGHRMVVIGFEDSVKGQRRTVVDDFVGGLAFKDDLDAQNATHNSEQWSWQDEEQQRQAKTISKAVRYQAIISGQHPVSDGATSPPPLLKQYPPNGGIGMRVLALWSYWPQEGVADELAFPKGAEMRECEDINGDWFWGIYCGRKGLIPGNYGRVLEVVGM